MGPIRAFSRPSHGAAPGEFVISASPYSPTQSYSAQHRPCCAHTTSSLTQQHPNTPFPHLYNCVCTPDALRVGFSSPSATLQPCIFHIKTLLPPGEAPTDPHPSVATRQGREAAGQDGRESEQQDEWSGRDNGEWSVAEDKCWWKKDSDKQKWKRVSGEEKCGESDHDTGKCKRKREGSDEWETKKDDMHTWKKSRNSYKWKNSKDNNMCKWKKESGDDDVYSASSGVEKNASGLEKETVVPPTLNLPPVVARTDEACSSRVASAFPFSDDEEDDEDDRGEGRGATAGRKHEAWPISDIVETEDEEGEQEPRGCSLINSDKRLSDSEKEDGGGDDESCNVVKINEAGCSAEPDLVNIVITQEVESGCVAGRGVGDDKSDKADSDSGTHAGSTQDGRVSSLSLPGHVDDPHEDLGVKNEDHTSPDENEGGEERRGEEEDSPRDSVRATQRLRPRSYRQFLLTRERRSRVFLKARSYQLGRWFVTHFTHPYPSKDQKDLLASRTNMNRNQVSEWFGNMRRRIREATRGLGVCWEERVRLYNGVITGKSEPLPILPGDAINTWIPPVADESPSLDQHGVLVSPKFKTTLLQRYLNNSFEAPVLLQPPGAADTQPPSPSSSPALEENNSTYHLHQDHHHHQHHHHHHQHQHQHHHHHQQEHQDSSTPTECSTVFSHPLPLGTSSPKERCHMQALWNSSFVHVKDTMGGPTGSEHKGSRAHGVRGRGELEGERVPRKYERPKNQHQHHNNNNNNNSVAGQKKQRTMGRDERSPYHTSSLLGSSFTTTTTTTTTSLLTLPRVAVGREEWKGRLHLPSSLPRVRYSDEDGGGMTQGFRQPEELAAAYTLMQLQHM